MKFDFCIGNPSYQEETEGTSDNPVYHYFMDAAYSIADKVELITPARFLFNAGKTPKAWNKKMLSDPHFKVLEYEQDSKKVFKNVNIPGGVAITYRDSTKNFGAIEVFSHFKELESLKRKVQCNQSLCDLIYSPESYKFTKKIHQDITNLNEYLSNGHDYDLTTNIFEKLSNIAFFDEIPDQENEYIQIYGRKNNTRIYMYIRKDYIIEHENLLKWKVFLPKSNGSGAIGEVLSTPVCGQPVCGQPLCGHTQSFMSIGAFDTQQEAEACLKYIKTKFARTCLGILKITQHNATSTWKYVPLQDFTVTSDIDWSKSIPEIDRQLYTKYSLTQDEIDFIETHVKEMI